MKKIIILITLFAFTVSFGQTFDQKLEELASEITVKLNRKNVKTVAVFPFFNIKKKETDLSLYISSEFYGYLNNSQTPKIIDRTYIDQLLEEHKLNSNGLIDPSTAKEFGKIIGVDAFITGKVFLFGSVVKINLHAIDPQTGESYASVISKLPIDYDLASFLNLENWLQKKEEAKQNTSENPNCAQENVGDYCFYNNLDLTFKVIIEGLYSKYRREMILSPQTKSCFKDLKAEAYSYRITERSNVIKTNYKQFEGEFRVKVCESKTHKIDNTETITQDPNTQYFTVMVQNPNVYSRKIVFVNSKKQQQVLIVAGRSKATIDLPKGRYSYTSKTTFSKSLVETGNFYLNQNNVISLQKDNYN